MSRTMKRRVFCGAVCEQIVYQQPERCMEPAQYDPEKKVKRERFATKEEYDKFKTGIARRRHYRMFQANFCAGDLFSTLTFDNEWEVTDFQEAKKVRSKWVRKIRSCFPEAVVFIYMGRGKSTHRIHFHMVSHGIPQEWIEKSWMYGSCKRVTVLRKRCKYDGVDCGQDYRGLANYCFDHWSMEQGGHRYYHSRNARKPEAEKPTECHVRYSAVRAPAAPKGYRLIMAEDIGYGLTYYRYVAEDWREEHRKRTVSWE